MTGARGFTAVELLMVIALIGVVTGIAMVQTRAGMVSFRASQATDHFKSKLLVARERAVGRQRTMKLEFPSTARMIVKQINSSSDQPQVDVAQFEGGMTLSQIAGQGVVPTTLDASCGTNNVLNGRTDLSFNSEGALIDDDTLDPVSGCFYLGSIFDPKMSRAIRIFGPTGQTRTYKWNRAEWIH